MIGPFHPVPVSSLLRARGAFTLMKKAVGLGLVGLVVLGLILFSFIRPPSVTYDRDTVKRVAEQIREMGTEGYDVLEAEYYLLSAIYYHRRGNDGKASALLNEAVSTLSSASLLPSPPPVEWKIREYFESRSIPSPRDVIPSNVFTVTRGGYLSYYRGDRWKLSCFIIVAVGKLEDGTYFFYQGRFPLMPKEGPFKPKVYIGGRWITPDVVFAGPIYVNRGDDNILIYQRDLSGKFLQILSFDSSRRLWVHEIKGNGTILHLEAKGEGLPMWLGDWNGSVIVHGVYPKARDLDLWAGFWEVGEMEGFVRWGDKEMRLRGFLVFDRASHRPLLLPEKGNVGAPLAFSCLVIHQKGLTVMIAHSSNPSPLNGSFEHQMRINIGNRSLFSTDFALEDDGDLQPSQFRVWGRFEGGWLNLTGKVVEFWPERWAIGSGTWWSGETFSWGRSFSRWSGEITLGDEVFKVDAWGVGEFTRCGQGGEVGGNGGCWGRWIQIPISQSGGS